MANDSFVIIHFDSADSAHTDAIADLAMLGIVQPGPGAVNSTGGYLAIGLCDGTDVYSNGILDYGGGYWTNGILDGSATYHPTGIFDGATYYSTGIWDGTTFYVNGIFDGNNGMDGTRHADGMFNGTVASPNQYGVGCYTGDGSGSYVNAGASGILNSSGNFYTTGILDAFGDHHTSGIWEGTSYNATGVFDGTSHNAFGILWSDLGTPIYADAGILVGTYRYASGVYDGSNFNGYGVLEEDLTFYALTAPGSTPYQTGAASVPPSDILGTGLI